MDETTLPKAEFEVRAGWLEIASLFSFKGLAPEISGVQIHPSPRGGAVLIAMDGHHAVFLHDEFGTVERPVVAYPSAGTLRATREKAKNVPPRYVRGRGGVLTVEELGHGRTVVPVHEAGVVAMQPKGPCGAAYMPAKAWGPGTFWGQPSDGEVNAPDMSSFCGKECVAQDGVWMVSETLNVLHQAHEMILRQRRWGGHMARAMLLNWTGPGQASPIYVRIANIEWFFSVVMPAGGGDEYADLRPGYVPWGWFSGQEETK